MDKTMKLITGEETVDGERQLTYKSYPYPLHVKGSLLKKGIDIAAELEGTGVESLSGKTVDKLADFVVEVYAKQFTRDELLDGLQAHEVMDKLTEVMMFVISGEEQAGNSKKFATEQVS